MGPAGLGTTLAHRAGASQMIESGDGGDDEADIPNILVADSPSVTIPALTKVFRVGDFFSPDAKHGLFAEVESDFTEIFGGQIVEPRTARRTRRHTLLRLAGIVRIEECFVMPPDVDFHAIAELVLRNTMRERGFGGLDNTPVASGVDPRMNLFRVDKWWIALVWEKRAWRMLMPDPQDIFAEYTKVFVPG